METYYLDDLVDEIQTLIAQNKDYRDKIKQIDHESGLL